MWVYAAPSERTQQIGHVNDVIKLLSMHKRNFPARFTISHVLLRKYPEY